jgi:hypothetical protein
LKAGGPRCGSPATDRDGTEPSREHHPIGRWLVRVPALSNLLERPAWKSSPISRTWKVDVTIAAAARPLAVIALATVAAASSLAYATAAQAAPTGCSITAHSFASVSSMCGTGTGEQRVTAQACSGVWGCTVTQNFSGPWVGVGGTSTITLTAAWFFPGNGSAAFVETRG